MPPKKPRYAQEHDALEEVLAGNDIEEVTNEATRIRLQLEFYRRLREAVFVNSASKIDSLDEVVAHALNSDGSSPPVLAKPILLLSAPEYQQGADPPGNAIFAPDTTDTKQTGRSRTVRSRSSRHKKQRTAKHKTKATKNYRVQLPTGVPRDVRLAIVGVIDKAAKQLKSPFRLA
ncbi:hypothetical protein PHMEG_0009018 [Phytophthora megakarya]|uniref:Uncharacterized protein n=1 Tax=Phytophthora megakarya TaxID=4795 RepID=A0A225WHJ2_9STRA|nr:hypothetical protein PHMEG_0009018 [Phytophthora megakarya]